MKSSYFLSLLCALFICCSGGNNQGDQNVGSIALGLTGQFEPGELQSLDIFIYNGAETECNRESGTLSSIPERPVVSETEISLSNPPGELSFVLSRGPYVIFAEAGALNTDSEFETIARACDTVELGTRSEAILNLVRMPTCGNGELDIQEQCDDNNVNDGDGCSSSCETEIEYVNDAIDFLEGKQINPRASGWGDILWIAWTSENLLSAVGPSRIYDSQGGAGDPFDYDTGASAIRRYTDIDMFGNITVMSYFIGPNSPESSTNRVLARIGESEPLDPVDLEPREDVEIDVALISGAEIIAVTEREGEGLFIKSITIGADTLILDGAEIPVDTETTGQTYASVAGAHGDFAIVWADDSANVWVRLYEGVDSPMEAQELCEGVGVQCYWPTLARLNGDSGDQYLLSYVADGYVVGKFMDVSGNIGDEFRISAATGCTRVEAEAFNEEFVVAWMQAVDPDRIVPTHIYARIVNGFEDFGIIPRGTEDPNPLSDEPYQLTLNPERSYESPAIATPRALSSDTSTFIIAFEDRFGIDFIADGTESDIGYRFLRLYRPPQE